MESLIEPGKIVEIGSPEWKIHMINERERCHETLSRLEKEKSLFIDYLNALNEAMEQNTKRGKNEYI